MYRIVELDFRELQPYMNDMWHEGYKLEQVIHKGENQYLIIFKKRYMPHF